MAQYDPANPNEAGKRLIDAWQAAKEALARAEQQKNRAECDLANATTALGMWMVPKDTKENESFSIWYGDNLIQVTKTDMNGNGSFTIEVRQRGKRGL